MRRLSSAARQAIAKQSAERGQFSVTSGTIFASRKLSFVDLLGAICLVVNASKGLSAVQLSRDLNVQHKTAFVLVHKLREVMAAERPTAWMGFTPILQKATSRGSGA